MPGWQLRSDGFPRPPIQTWASNNKLTTQILLAEPHIANKIISVARTEQLALGLFGDVKLVGECVSEL